MKKPTKFLLWFIAGNAVQLIVHAVALNLWEYRQIPFCLAAGFLITVAIFAGTRIGAEPATAPRHYHEYAEVIDDEQQE